MLCFFNDFLKEERLGGFHPSENTTHCESQNWGTERVKCKVRESNSLHLR